MTLIEIYRKGPSGCMWAVFEIVKFVRHFFKSFFLVSLKEQFISRITSSVKIRNSLSFGKKCRQNEAWVGNDFLSEWRHKQTSNNCQENKHKWTDNSSKSRRWQTRKKATD